MSRIDALLAELCPDGVKFKELGDVCLIKTGQPVNKIMIQNNPGEFPVINSGREPLGFFNKFNVENDPIGITSRGAGVGSITWWDGKYFRGNLNYSATIKKNSQLTPRFLYHYLMGNQESIQKLATYDGIPALNASNLKKFRIPIPPLEIQREIVKILDTFTKLEAELEAELEARQKQYHYYRNQLLTFDNRDDVRWATLGEIVHFINAKPHEKLIDPEGDIKLLTSRFISTEGKSVVLIKREDVLTPALKNDVAMVMSDLPNGKALAKTFFVNEDNRYAANQRVCLLRIRDNSIYLPKFLHYIVNRNKQLLSYDSGVDQTNLKKDWILAIRIPIPPLEIQREIVAILDKFDALVNDLSIGLPAEIKARRQQYAYYRDRLLTFQEAT